MPRRGVKGKLGGGDGELGVSEGWKNQQERMLQAAEGREETRKLSQVNNTILPSDSLFGCESF